MLPVRPTINRGLAVYLFKTVCGNSTCRINDYLPSKELAVVIVAITKGIVVCRYSLKRKGKKDRVLLKS